jgi:hypothetical protein
MNIQGEDHLIRTIDQCRHVDQARSAGPWCIFRGRPLSYTGSSGDPRFELLIAPSDADLK